MNTIALYGGSFDPPHLGHMLVAAYVLGAYPIDSLWIVPAYKHRDKKLTDFHHRRKMCQHMVASFHKVSVTNIAQTIAREKPDYEYDRTIDLVRHCTSIYPLIKFRWVMGDDLLSSCHTWENWDEIEKTAKPIIIGRLGYGGSGFQLPNVSSSTIREHINHGVLDTLVPHRVGEYIRHHKLYGA